MSQQTQILARIERFNRRHGGGVSAVYRQGGYTLTVAETGAPVARLKPTGHGDTMRVYYWSHRETWADAGPLGGVTLPLDAALKTIANEPVFWAWD
jgi:hypothetical protein